MQPSTLIRLAASHLANLQLFESACRFLGSLPSDSREAGPFLARLLDDSFPSEESARLAARLRAGEPLGEAISAACAHLSDQLETINRQALDDLAVLNVIREAREVCP